MASGSQRLAAKARALLSRSVAAEPEPPRNMVCELEHQFDYYFDPIAWFDARHGYKRFPGGAASAVDTPRGYAYLWRSPAGEVVARMTSQGHRIAFKVSTEPGAPVRDDEIDIVNDDLMNLLDLWIFQGADAWPEI